MAVGDILLYDMEMSPFCQLVRLQMAEKGLTYKTKVVSAATNENLEPYYVQVNPEMTVPTLSIQAKEGEANTLIRDSRDIIEHLEYKYEGGKDLVDASKKKETWKFVDEWYSLNLTALYINAFRENSPAMFDMMRNGMLAKKVDLLTINAQKYPELKSLYEKKREKTLVARDTIYDSTDAYVEANKHMEELIAAAEEQLKSSEGPWLFGDYSIADAALTCFLCAFNMFDLVDFEGKPNLAKFFAEAKKRPSYKGAKILDEVPMKMKVMLVPLLLIHKIKSTVGPFFSKKMKEADEAYEEVKKAANEKLDQAIGAKK
mmetsp:Transcript_4022/g.6909  ORF Transcript_4022/g.6909 Transcript_4022/m.6909 type:complete len:316 (-) Transcript_4022:143-1090(-)